MTIESPEDFIKYAEKHTRDKLANSIRGYLVILSELMKGEKKYSRNTIEYLVNSYNDNLRLFVCGDEKLIEKYEYTYNKKRNELCGPILDENENDTM